MKQILLLLLCIVPSSLIAASDHAEEHGYLRSPMTVGNGIVFTDNYGSALYLRTADGEIRRLASSPGAGMYFCVSPDKKRIGFKSIGGDGLQTPAMIDAATGAVRMLADPSHRTGQVSFTADGRYAFTVGTTFVVTDGSSEIRRDLGTYANIAPVSPNGTRVVFNDAGDQLWMMDIATAAKTMITDRTRGFFTPQWSPDGGKILYSGLDGSLFVYNLQTAATAALGEGFSPAWSADGNEVAFYRKEIEADSLVNSDIYIASADGRSVRRVTFTEDICEMDPSFDGTSPGIVYHTYTRCELGIASASDGVSVQGIRLLPRLYPVQIAPTVSSIPQSGVRAPVLDVPYINQVYDTPDWFNGHSACGPTTSMMALAYFNILPAWETSCSKPSWHINNWGKYISEVYSFRGTTFAASASDPNKRAAQGAFGYMWSTGSPQSRMSGFYALHGVQSTTFFNHTHADALAEIVAGRPYSLCNGLTTAGHIVLAHGIDPADTRTFIVNDPYGDKNKPGYPNYHGKDAKYDWPGYNNGYNNFTVFYWGATASYTAPAQADSVVDDLQYGKGFYMHTKSPAAMPLWKEKTAGYKSHFWYVFSTGAAEIDTCYAVWTPTLDKAGRYEVFAFIPFYSALYAQGAKYKVASRTGVQTVVVDQKEISNVFTRDTLISLGTFNFDKGSTGSVRLGDATGIRGQAIVVDAMVWKYRGAGITSVRGGNASPAGFGLSQNFPNPFNPSTVIGFSIPVGSAGHATLRVFDVLGREAACLMNGHLNAGSHTVRWDAAELPGGVYVYRLTVRSGASGEFSDAKRMLYIK